MYNPASGDQTRQAIVLKILKEKLCMHEIVCTYSTARFLNDFSLSEVIADDRKAHGTAEDSIRAGMLLIDVDLVIVIGGDGTVCDVVLGQRMAGKTVPTAGVACGTANAGALIAFNTAEDLRKHSFDKKMVVKPILGIDVYRGKQLVGVAFNDVVFSDCVVSTVDGTTQMVKAREFLSGKKIPASPASIGTVESKIVINDRIVTPDFNIGQIIISPIHNPEVHRAKALSGKLCWLPYTNMRGAMVVTDRPVIKMTTSKDLDPSVPLLMSQFIFGEQDVIRVYGTKGFSIVDGNPRINMEEENSECVIKLNPRAALKYGF